MTDMYRDIYIVHRDIPVVDVLRVAARMRESLEAFFALERFLARVKPFVFGEMVLVLKGLPADVARKRTGTWKMN